MNTIGQSFIKVYCDNYGKIDLTDEQVNLIDQMLNTFIHFNAGYHFNNNYNRQLLANYFFSIYRHIYSKDTFVNDVKNYIHNYFDVFDNHPLVKSFLETIKWIYSDEYDGKLATSFLSAPSNVLAEVTSKAITIKNISSDNALPMMQIKNVDTFEKVLEDYIKSIKLSDTLYNIFDRDDFMAYSENQKIKMLFEGTILNASPFELLNLEAYFIKYTNFIIDEAMSSLSELKFMGNAFNDELYFKTKRSDFEFETPYSMSFMLRHHRFEFPNIRAGIYKSNGTLEANILTTQSSQLTGENKEVSTDIKHNIPKSSTYRYYKPNHFASLLMGFGLFGGLGINRVSVQTLLPLRYYKTIKDKGLNEEEREHYLSRMLDKNINTYYKLQSHAYNLEMSTKNNQLLFENVDQIRFDNDYLNDLYNIGYNFGKSSRGDI